MVLTRINRQTGKLMCVDNYNIPNRKRNNEFQQPIDVVNNVRFYIELNPFFTSQKIRFIIVIFSDLDPVL